ncbi:hypothetical protein D3C87_185160 [compost metagenome]
MKIEKKRILSIDILRGLVMVIMALDHTRDFFHHNGSMMTDPMNPDTTNVFLYFTRWITHFCAPTFVFLSGISAYLSSQNKTPKQASSFLIKRGIWLIIVEIALITLGLTFNPFYNFIILQVIWAIGCSMILLGLCSLISRKLVLGIGLLLFFGHNILNYLSLVPTNTFGNGLLQVLFNGTMIPIGKSHFIGAFYSVLPWTAIMFMGYSIGYWYNASFDSKRRRQFLSYSGLALLLGFIILRYFSGYGNPTPRKEYTDTLKNIFDFFNVSKYPPSLQFYGMTLGPALLLLSAIENVKNKFTDIMSVYGNVPFFYYVLHFYLIHGLTVICFFASGYGAADITSPNSPFLFRPDSFGYNLVVVYLVWLFVVGLLYRPCIWFKHYKLTHQQWWLRYL